MDDADRAQAREEEFRADAEAERRRHWQAHALKPTGYCQWCGEQVRGNLLFCQPNPGDKWTCQSDYEADEARKRREGRT